MMYLCSNCEVPMSEAETEDGNCPTCGLKMEQVSRLDPAKQVEFDLMLTALLYGKKP